MKTYKTPTSKRTTYKLYDDNGSFVTEYKPGKDGVTEEAILFMHRLDDAVTVMREIVSRMPKQWQQVYRLVFLEDMSKNKAGQIIGISDVRVGQLVKKIKAELAQNS